MNYYKKLREKFGDAAKIPKGWRLVRVGERLHEESKLFVFSNKRWENNGLNINLRRERHWDFCNTYIKPK
jgi:hypothetical protein